ncbi:MAG: hypothetical protein F4W89_06550 [Acidobacteria bacterium]|nr:hypothetical protein [Acidobacteriota bacterium]
MRRVAGLVLAGAAAFAVVVVGGVALAPYLLSQFLALLNATASGLAWLLQAAEEGRGFWEVTMTAMRTIGSAMASPSVIGVIVAVEVLGLVALYGLDRMLSAERRGHEVPDEDDGPDQGMEKK